MNNNIKAGFLQFNPTFGDTEKNIGDISRLLSRVSDIDVIVLPELANTGYNFMSYSEAFALAEETGKSKFIDFLAGMASQLNCFIVSGICEKEGEHLYNTSVLICPVRGLAGKYRKVHLFMNEKNIFRPGNLGFPVFDTGRCKIAMLVCFDWMFPEAWRSVALQGATVVCHPSNLVLPYAQQAVPVHALINRMFVITSNRYGNERGVTFSGKSFIANPDGSIAAIAPPDQDSLMTAKLDLHLATDKSITPFNDALDDRMPSQYRILVDEPGSDPLIS